MADDDVLNGKCIFFFKKRNRRMMLQTQSKQTSAALISFNPFQTKKKVDCKRKDINIKIDYHYFCHTSEPGAIFLDKYLPACYRKSCCFKPCWKWHSRATNRRAWPQQDSFLSLKVLFWAEALTAEPSPASSPVVRCRDLQWLFFEEPKPEKPITAAISSSSSKSTSSSARRFLSFCFSFL